MELVREAKKEDLQDILRLYQQLFPDEDYSNSGHYLETWNEILSDKKIVCFIVYVESVPVSTCLISIIPNLSRDQRPYALIENVVTHKDYRRKGFGKLVMEKAVNFAKQKNCYKVMFLSSSARKEAHLFYTKIGFDGISKKGFQLRIP
jgi:GNAT superfamily N-acetyltransferase